MSIEGRDERREVFSQDSIGPHIRIIYAHLLIAPTFLSLDLPFEILVTVVSFLNERIYEIHFGKKESRVE